MTSSDQKEPEAVYQVKSKLSLPEIVNRPLYAQAGKLCPVCGEAEIDYDGMLNLVCPKCGFYEGGCFT